MPTKTPQRDRENFRLDFAIQLAIWIGLALLAARAQHRKSTAPATECRASITH